MRGRRTNEPGEHHGGREQNRTRSHEPAQGAARDRIVRRSYRHRITSPRFAAPSSANPASNTRTNRRSANSALSRQIGTGGWWHHQRTIDTIFRGRDHAQFIERARRPVIHRRRTSRQGEYVATHRLRSNDTSITFEGEFRRFAAAVTALRDFRPCGKLNQSSRPPRWRARPERHDIVEQAEQQQTGQQILFVVLPKRHQHRRVEHAEPAGRVAGKSEQCRGDEDDREFDEPD